MRISDWSSDVCSSDLYTDKGAGSDYFDLDARVGVRADGTTGAPGDGDLAFAPDAPAAASGVAVKHAHSKDNPEADWGRHVKQAARFALHALGEAVPDATPFTFDNTRVIAVGISNGGEIGRASCRGRGCQYV